MKNKVFNFIFLMVTLDCLYSFTKIYYSYTQQKYILTDLNESSWEKRSNEFIDNIQTDYPNLSLTALNLKTAKAQYYLYTNEFQKGLDLLEDAIKENSNPYIMFTEATYAKIYNATGVRDSAYHYARKAFNGLPRNPYHYSELARMYAQQSISDEKYIDSITFYFKKIQYPAEHQIWKVFLASMVNFKEQGDSIFIDSVARESLKLFPERQDVQIAAYYALYGVENTKIALESETEGKKLYNEKKYNEAMKKFKIADSLQPINIVHKENIAATYFNQQNWDDTIKSLTNIESEHELDMVQNYILGLSYFNTLQSQIACRRLTMSLDQGYLLAQEAINTLCFNKN